MTLDFYYLPTCPFCMKVRRFIDRNGLAHLIRNHDVEANEVDHRRLVELTGDDQVPCLVIDGKPMLESDDIITWLDQNLVKRKPQETRKIG